MQAAEDKDAAFYIADPKAALLAFLKDEDELGVLQRWNRDNWATNMLVTTLVFDLRDELIAWLTGDDQV
jgi:hypothetical protein